MKGPSGPLVVSVGSSVVLPCSVPLRLLKDDLKVEWRRTDSKTLVHLYQDGEIQKEAQQKDYNDRAHFFTDDIKHGNFSLCLDNLRAGDEGKYECNIYSQQDFVFSTETNLEPRLGKSTHIMCHHTPEFVYVCADSTKCRQLNRNFACLTVRLDQYC